jgi:hypothetical protein
MVNDATTFSHPLFSPIRNEELEKTPFDMNLFQQLHEEKSIGKVV